MVEKENRLTKKKKNRRTIDDKWTNDIIYLIGVLMVIIKTKNMCHMGQTNYSAIIILLPSPPSAYTKRKNKMLGIKLKEF